MVCVGNGEVRQRELQRCIGRKGKKGIRDRHVPLVKLYVNTEQRVVNQLKALKTMKT